MKDYLNKKSLGDGTEVRMFRNLTKDTNSVQMYVSSISISLQGNVFDIL